MPHVENRKSGVPEKKNFGAPLWCMECQAIRKPTWGRVAGRMADRAGRGMSVSMTVVRCVVSGLDI